MAKFFLFISVLVVIISVPVLSSELLAVVDGHKITTEVAPKDFKTMNKSMQKIIINRLIEKRIASNYALSTSIVKKKKYQKTLKHILNMGKTQKRYEDNFLANILKKDTSIKGYTKEQLYSKKGLLAFDFIVSEHAKKIKLSSKKLKEYYNLHKYKYDTPEKKELLVIVVDDKKLSDKILKKIKVSKDKLHTFMTLAKKYSQAPSAKLGGYFGKIPTFELNNVLKPILKDLKRGEYTHKAIKTEFGYQIFYILNSIDKFDSKIELVKEDVKNKLMKQEVKKWAMNKIKALKSKANIKIIKQ